MNGTLNGTHASASPDRSPTQQRKNSTVKGRQMESGPNSPENAQQGQSRFVRDLPIDQLRSTFRQMHVDESGPSREDGEFKFRGL